MKYIFILNSFGTKNIKDIYKSIDDVCHVLKLDYKIEVNSKNETTSDILRKYQEKSDIIFAVGGDGMINKVLNGIVNTNNTLGYIPYGTGNDFDKTVKETLDCGYNDIDIVKINDKYFVNIACFGIDADIANDDYIIHNKLIPKSQRYNVSVLYHFIKYKARSLEILVDNETIKNDYTTVVVANARYYGGGYKVGTNSLINDGLLDIYLIENMNKLKMAKSIMSMKNGGHENIKETRKITTKTLAIRSNEPFKCNIDGEILEASNFDIKIIKNGIKLYKDPALADKILRKI